jgi:hypothetical protein
MGPDQQDVPQIRIADQVLKQFASCRVEPLQIVEKQRERMLRTRERAEEPSEYHLEAILGILQLCVPLFRMCLHSCSAESSGAFRFMGSKRKNPPLNPARLDESPC